MKKIMFDGDSYTELIEKELDINLGEKTKDLYEYYISPIQVNKLVKDCDSEMAKLVKTFEILLSLKATLVYDPAVSDDTKIGESKIVSNEEAKMLKELSNGDQSNHYNEIIGTVASQEGCTIVTDNSEYTNKLKQRGISTMSFNDWFSSF